MVLEHPATRTDPAAAAPPGRAPGDLAGTDAWRLYRVWVLVATPVLLLYTWVLTAGRWDLLQRQFYDDFYDAQARAWLDGRWGVPPDVVGLEGIPAGDQVHIYFGPLPALARLPLLLVTDRFDGRLTTLSMLAAMALLAVFAYRLSLAVRTFVRGTAPVTRVEVVTSGALALAVLTAPPFWLASIATVHHEALLWGVALMVGALDAVARWVLEPRRARLLVAGALVTATLSTRLTLGFGALIALGLAAAGLVAGETMARRRERTDLRPAAAMAASVLLVGVVAVAVAAVPGLARFGQPFGVPFERQFIMEFPEGQGHLEANDGQLFGLRYAPTTLANYLRPDGFTIRSDLPWIDYPAPFRSTLGPGIVAALDPTSSIPVTMPLLTVLGAAGAVVMARSLGRRHRGPVIWVACLWAGTLAATGGVILLGSVTHRYLVDFYPAVLVAALVGYHDLMARLHRVRPGRPQARTWARRVVATLAVVSVLGAGVNTLFALQHQREQTLLVPESWRSAWMHRRATLPSTDPPVRVDLGRPLPADADPGTTAVVGDCDGLYVLLASPERWVPVERGPGVDVYDLRVDLGGVAGLAPDERAPLLTYWDDSGVDVVAASLTGDGEARLHVWDDASDRWEDGPILPLDSEKVVRVSGDERAHVAGLPHGDEHYVGIQLPERSTDPGDATAAVALGQGPDLPGLLAEYPGDVVLEPVEPAACRALLAEE